MLWSRVCLLSDWFSLTDSWDVPPLSLSACGSPAPALVTLYSSLSQDPRSHNPARDFGDSTGIMTFMTGVRNASSILLTSWRSEWSEDQRKQMSWATASVEIDVQSDIPVLVSALWETRRTPPAWSQKAFSSIPDPLKLHMKAQNTQKTFKFSF